MQLITTRQAQIIIADMVQNSFKFFQKYSDTQLAKDLQTIGATVETQVSATSFVPRGGTREDGLTIAIDMRNSVDGSIVYSIHRIFHANIIMDSQDDAHQLLNVDSISVRGFIQSEYCFGLHTPIQNWCASGLQDEIAQKARQDIKKLVAQKEAQDLASTLGLSITADSRPTQAKAKML